MAIIIHALCERAHLILQRSQTFVFGQCRSSWGAACSLFFFFYKAPISIEATLQILSNIFPYTVHNFTNAWHIFFTIVHLQYMIDNYFQYGILNTPARP